MQTSSSIKLPQPRTATDLARDLPLGIVGKKILVEGQTPAQFLVALTHARQYADALRLMSVALLPREAVWWACLCCKHTLEAKVAPTLQARHALETAIRWVLQPDDANRNNAASAGATAGPKSAAGCAALAASHAGTPRMVASLAGAAVLLAVGAGKATDMDLNYRQFIGLGIDVDNHLCHWEKRPAVAPAYR